jgi:hypothetical protein
VIARIQTLITVAPARSQRKGFSRRASVRFYIETAILLGIDFETDPQYPWARQIRAAPASDEMERADPLHARGIDLVPMSSHRGGRRRPCGRSQKERRAPTSRFS